MLKKIRSNKQFKRNGQTNFKIGWAIQSHKSYQAQHLSSLRHEREEFSSCMTFKSLKNILSMKNILYSMNIIGSDFVLYSNHLPLCFLHTIVSLLLSIKDVSMKNIYVFI